MGFIYNKPLSIEQIFSNFDKNNDGKISAKELTQNKNTIFEGFVFHEGMTLQEFEEVNFDVYQQYEELNTEAYSRQRMKNALSESDYDEAAKAYKEVKQKQDDRIEKMVEQALKEQTPKFGLDGDKEEYVVPDPTLCRDPETNDW